MSNYTVETTVEIITFKAAVMPGVIVEFVSPAPINVGQALEIAGLKEIAEGTTTEEGKTVGYELRLNGAVVGMDTDVPNNSIILLLKKIKGNK